MAGGADEGTAGAVLGFAGAFADEKDLRVGVAFAENGLRALLAEASARAAADLLLVEFLEDAHLFLSREDRRVERAVEGSRGKCGLNRGGRDL